MKAAWLITNFAGLGLVVCGALYMNVPALMTGMVTMGVSVLLRKRVFRDRKRPQ